MVARVSPPELPDTLQQAIEQFGEGPFAVGTGSPYAGRYDDDGILKLQTSARGGLGLAALREVMDQAEAEYAARRAKYLAPEPKPELQGIMSLPLTANQIYNNYLSKTNDLTIEEWMKLYRKNLGIK